MLQRLKDAVSGDPMLGSLKDSVQDFLTGDQKAAIQKELAGLKHDPKTVGELVRFSDLANRMYAGIERPGDDSKGAELKKREAIDKWALNLQHKLYDSRDQLLKKDPALLDSFSISQQYRDQTGQSQVPAAIGQVDSKLGTVLFTGSQVPNDCGVFAGRLYEKLSALAVDDTMKKLQGDWTKPDATVSPEHVKALRDSLQSVNLVKLDAPPDASWNHHVKTQIGTDSQGRVFAWEAHTGKPFMLSPELHIYPDQNAFSGQRVGPGQVPPVIKESKAAVAEFGQLAQEGARAEQAAQSLTTRIRSGLETPLGVKSTDIAQSAQKRTGLVNSIIENKVRNQHLGMTPALTPVLAAPAKALHPFGRR